MSDSDYKIHIQTTADTSGADRTKESLDKLGNSGRDLNDVNIDDLKGQMALLAPVVAGIGTAFALAKKAVDEFAEAEKQVAQLDAALANAGRLTDAYREKLQDLAGELQSTTAIADDKWLGVLTTLTKFGADESNIERYTDAVKNLAGFMGGDIESAAFLFGKAMQGSTEMLGRYGIEVDKSASKTEQLEGIMVQLAQRGGGQLEAMASTTDGSFAKLGNNISDLFENFGRLINNTGILRDGLGLLNLMLGGLNDAMGAPIERVGGLTNRINLQKLSAEELTQALADYKASLSSLGDQSIESGLNKQTAALDAQSQAARDLAKAQRELSLAQLENRTDLSPEEKATKKAEILKAAAEAEMNAEISLAKDKIAGREKAITDLENTASENRSRLAEQQAKAEAAARLEAESQTAADLANKLAAQKAALESKLESSQQREARSASQGVLNPGAFAEQEQLRKEIEETELARQKAAEAVNGEAAQTAQLEREKLELLKAQTVEANKQLETTAKRLKEQNERETESAKNAQEIAKIEQQTLEETNKKNVETVRANQKRDEDAIKAAKEKLDLETKRNEALKNGNEELAKQYDYQLKYNSLIERGVSPQDASRYLESLPDSAGVGSRAGRGKSDGRAEESGSGSDPQRRGERASRLRDLAGGMSYTRDGRTYDRLGNEVTDEESARAARNRFRRQADGTLGDSTLDGRPSLGPKQKPRDWSETGTAKGSAAAEATNDLKNAIDQGSEKEAAAIREASQKIGNAAGEVASAAKESANATASTLKAFANEIKVMKKQIENLMSNV